MRILMSAAASPAAISFSQHLKSLGHQVLGIDANLEAMPIAEHYCDQFYVSPLATDPAFPGFISSLEPEFDLYLPFIDEELLALSEKTISTSLKDKILLCPRQTIYTCSSKIRFQLQCEALGLPIASQTLTLPAIFKPEFGRGGRGVTKINDPELLHYYQNKKGVIQTCLIGVEYTVDVLTSKRGNWLFGVARKRLQAAGVSTIGQIDCHPAVMALAKRCVELFEFNYCINIQIMLDSSGIAHLIEINPRLAGSSLFSIYAGFDIIDLSIKTFFNQSLSLPKYSQIKPIKVIRHWSEYVC
jgi:carbamoyl-phosphate synthase large subunit